MGMMHDDAMLRDRIAEKVPGLERCGGCCFGWWDRRDPLKSKHYDNAAQIPDLPEDRGEEEKLRETQRVAGELARVMVMFRVHAHGLNCECQNCRELLNAGAALRAVLSKSGSSPTQPAAEEGL